MIRIVILASIIGFSLPVLAQGTIDKHGRYVPTQEEIESNKRMIENLRNPDFIRLRLVFLNPNTDQTTDFAPRYNSGDPISFRLILFHFFNGPITVTDSLNKYRDFEVELLRDGDVVPYSKEARRYVKRARTEPPNDSSSTMQLLPDKDYVLRRISLSDWYETLLPGHYQLTVKQRFVSGGEWVHSDSITFDIGPDRSIGE